MNKNSVMPKFMNFASDGLSRDKTSPAVDVWFLGSVLIIIVMGLIMVASASISAADRIYGEPFYFLSRQGFSLAIGLGIASLVWRIPLAVWSFVGPMLMLLGILMLMLLLIPGFGHTVNGSTRWFSFGGMSVQVSEFVKLGIIIYLASYIARRAELIQKSFRGFFMPMLLIGLIAALLLAQPDFGAAVVIGMTALCMLLLAGVKLRHFILLSAMIVSSFVVLAVTTPYRMQRLTSFLDPWADPFNSGFQLSQALIAFGRGEWLGVGLGSSVQKLFYLPEAHTDFLFAVLAEELGFIAVVSVILLFALLAWRAFAIGRIAQQKEKLFGAFIAYGIGFWLVLQAYINVGVNMGVLPTKGLTLPLMSYGGNSIVVSCIAIALILRVDVENRHVPQKLAKGARR